MAFVCLNNADVIVKDQPIMYIVTIATFSYCLTVLPLIVVNRISLLTFLDI